MNPETMAELQEIKQILVDLEARLSNIASYDMPNDSHAQNAHHYVSTTAFYVNRLIQQDA